MSGPGTRKAVSWKQQQKVSSLQPAQKRTTRRCHRCRWHNTFLIQANHPTTAPCATRTLTTTHFCFLVAALRPCQGRLPRRKYIST